MTFVMTNTMATIIRVRIGLKYTMDAKTLTMVMAEDSSCGILWLIICRRVSVSLV